MGNFDTFCTVIVIGFNSRDNWSDKNGLPPVASTSKPLNPSTGVSNLALTMPSLEKRSDSLSFKITHLSASSTALGLRLTSALYVSISFFPSRESCFEPMFFEDLDRRAGEEVGGTGYEMSLV